MNDDEEKKEVEEEKGEVKEEEERGEIPNTIKGNQE